MPIFEESRKTAAKAMEAEGLAHMLGEREIARKLAEFRLAFADFTLSFRNPDLMAPPSNSQSAASKVERVRNEAYEMIAKKFSGD
jgi:hypothetical protein